MPRTARAIEGGMVYHVLNRGNARMRIYRKAIDHAAFERVLAEGLRRYPVDWFTYCLMPNHWHLVVRPRTGMPRAQLQALHASVHRGPPWGDPEWWSKRRRA